MPIFKKILSEEKTQVRVKNRRVHMANERTFLSWIRTSIAIMAFGFVVEKFIIPFDHNRIRGSQDLYDGCNCSLYFGVFVVFLGGIVGFLSTYRFLKTEREIMEDTYHPSFITDILVAIVLSSIGMLLAIYLINRC